MHRRRATVAVHHHLRVRTCACTPNNHKDHSIISCDLNVRFHSLCAHPPSTIGARPDPFCKMLIYCSSSSSSYRRLDICRRSSAVATWTSFRGCGWWLLYPNMKSEKVMILLLQWASATIRERKEEATAIRGEKMAKAWGTFRKVNSNQNTRDVNVQ